MGGVNLNLLLAMIWGILAGILLVFSWVFVLGLCASASFSEREIERLQADIERMRRELDQL